MLSELVRNEIIEGALTFTRGAFQYLIQDKNGEGRLTNEEHENSSRLQERLTTPRVIVWIPQKVRRKHLMKLDY